MLYVHGLGHFHPENEIDNAFLESLDIGTNDEWIVSRVGIHSRRTVLPLDYIRSTKNRQTQLADEAALYTNGQTGARAARMAIERAGLQPGDIGMVIAGGSSPQTLIPAEASIVAHELNIDVPAFDMHAACSTFGLQLHFLANQGTALPDYVLCVVPENSTRVVDYSDRSAAILFGDASAAGVVSTKHPARASVSYSCFGAAPAGCMDVVIPRTGHFVQNGSRVQKFAIKRMAALLRQCQDRVGAERAAQLVYVGHQANFTMLKSVAKRCQVAGDRHWYNIDQFGNQAAAGAPVVLSQRWDDIVDGEQVAMIVVGSGLSWSTLLIQFGPA
ncbi:MAG: ketoacyl-ACP synthase III [Deltaproteobacteria bacterium]|nr:ketoacyl-ACP synthase III [Deltaproteobacteria bacterium]